MGRQRTTRPATKWKDSIDALARIKRGTHLFEFWCDYKRFSFERNRSVLNAIIKTTGHGEEYPEWKKSWSTFRIPRLVRPGDKLVDGKALHCGSWENYFSRQTAKIKTFLLTSELVPFCEELSYLLHEIASDKRSFYVLKQDNELMMKLVNNGQMTKDRVYFMQWIDEHENAFNRSLHYLLGWYQLDKERVKMLPNYEFGREERARRRMWGKHSWPRVNYFLTERNEDIRKYGQDLRERRGLSKRGAAEILSKPPYEFFQNNGKRLSAKQIAKLIP